MNSIIREAAGSLIWGWFGMEIQTLSWSSKALVLNLGLLRSFGLQLPEAFTTNCAGWGFWELQFKNIRVTKVKNHCSRAVIPNLGPPDVFGLQLPETLASRGGGEGFWNL